MLINLRNAMMAGKRLPYDAEVEYLESTGTQWIDTGVAPVDDATFVVCAAFTNLNTGRFGAVQLIGSSTTYRYYFGVSNGKWIGAINSVGYNHDISQADTDIHIFKTNNLGLYIDDIMVVAAENSKPTNSVCLTNVGGTAIDIPTKAKLYSCKIYDANGVIISDLIPVRRTLDGQSVGEMYDRVTGTFMERHGTFVTGPDVASGASAANGGGGCKLKCIRRSHRRSLRPSARFCARLFQPRLWKEVA